MCAPGPFLVAPVTLPVPSVVAVPAWLLLQRSVSAATLLSYESDLYLIEVSVDHNRQSLAYPALNDASWRCHYLNDYDFAPG